ncbi:hypothetical protein niasHT_021813 [Heterodera trifolii]|uniref:Uncharacterized protein n=1 Tax=Heterodera trifolii TaxID=157864 RepID=A0ABD2J8S3_9BILA
MDPENERIPQRPRTVDTEEYVRARIEQIAELLEVVDNPSLGFGEVTSGPRTVFQRLPRHMRRRAMSHNVKRLPRALRPIAARHTQRTAHRKKAPSRKWRRRPTRMLKLSEKRAKNGKLGGNKNSIWGGELNTWNSAMCCTQNRWVREQRKNIWLETHIWHAKRFHMTELWGYKLPMKSCQRGFRPNYRCAVRSAVSLDQSYLCCLQFVVSAQISSDCKMKIISEVLAQFCEKRVSPTFAHFGALSCHLEVPLMLFSPGKYPHGFLGPGRAMWTEDGRLFLWVHPSIERQLAAEMGKVPQISIVSPTKTKRMEKGDQQIGEEAKKGTEAQIELVNLRNRLCRFHLIGPKAVEFLRKVIRVANGGAETGQMDDRDNHSAQFSEMHQWWHTLPSDVLPGNLRDGQIVALLVEDPRLFRAMPTPQQQPIQRPHQQTDTHFPRPPPSALFADWQFFHQNLLPKRLSHSEFESFCEQKVTKCFLIFFFSLFFSIPILLVFRRISAPSSSTQNIALHCVDLICPSGVGYDFWLALQFAGFRPIGLHDKRALDFEAAIGTFPDDFVDCRAGTEAAQTEAKHLMGKYERRPHNRRIEFGEKGLNVAHPFTFEWETLLSEWDTTKGRRNSTCESPPPFFVLRGRQALKRFDCWFVGRLNANAAGDDSDGTSVPPPILEECFATTSSSSVSSIVSSSSVLVPVFLQMLRRGVPKRLSLITLPTDQDMQMLRSEGNHGRGMITIGSRIVTIREQGEELSDTAATFPLEPSPPFFSTACHIPEFISLHDQQQLGTVAHYFPTDRTCEGQLLSLEAMFPDGANDKERRRKARNVSKRAKKRAKMARKKSGEKEEDEEGEPMETEIGQAEERSECSTKRKLIGRVVRGDFAFGNAQGMAFGFVPLNAFAAITRTNGIVLVRNTTSKYYHPARINIHLVDQNAI